MGIHAAAQNIHDDETAFITLVYAIAEVESGHDETAICEGGGHVGLLQISKIAVDDCNRILGYRKFIYQDRLIVRHSVEMFRIIQRHYNKDGDIEKAIRIWNGGPHYRVEDTEAYYQKVMKVLEPLNSKRQ